MGSISPHRTRSGRPGDGGGTGRASAASHRTPGSAEGWLLRTCGGLDEPVLEGVADGCAAVRHAELPVDVGEMELDCVLAQPQLLADRFSGHSARDGLKD